MEIFLEFLSVYWLGVAIYPFYLWFWFISTPIWLVAWLVIGLLLTATLVRFALKKWLKFFVAIWVLPGTVICGAGSVAPWPFALMSLLASEGGCTPAWALVTALLFNLFLVFASAIVLQRFKLNRQATNA